LSGVPLPLDTQLFGVNFFNQAFVLDGTANRLGVGASNGGAGAVGIR
jgi:hypothetical protein